MSDPIIFKPNATIVAKVMQLPSLSMTELKALWREFFHHDPPAQARSFIERRLAYKLQEEAFKKKYSHMIEENERRINAVIEYENNTKKSKNDPYSHMTAGTVLTRNYQGREYRVTIASDGRFEFEGRWFNSLSVIAREITGSHISGPRFFGLKRVATKKKTTEKKGR